MRREDGQSALRGARKDARMFAEYLGGLRSFLRTPLPAGEARRRIEARLARRPLALLELLEQGVLAHPESPYAKLLVHAGLELGDLRASLDENGVEGTLELLFDHGVRLSVDEFKGKAPIRRGSLELAVTAADFDNPLVRRAFDASTGGSGGSARSVAGNFELMEESAAYLWLIQQGFGVEGRPYAVWQPMPPSLAGVASALTGAKLRQPLARWFTPTGLGHGRIALQQVATVGSLALAARLARTRIPLPKHTPPERADVIAEWLGECVRAGTPGFMQTTPSAGVRVCLAAEERGIDIAGTLFIFGGEPYTPAKAAVVERAGCTGTSPYGMTEIGLVGMPCAAPSELDDTHVAADKVAVLTRPDSRLEDGAGEALYLTGLQGGAPKLMINVESGDFAVREERDCGCFFEELGYGDHLHSIRSYEKLTSEGMTFFGTRLVALIEEVLPLRFGGAPTDYQLVERDDSGVGRIELRASPRLGSLDEAAVADAVLRFLRESSPHEEFMADVWKAADTIRVVREEPHVTGAGKVLPLYVLRAASPRAGARS